MAESNRGQQLLFVCLLQTGLSGNIMILSVLYKGGLLMASQHLSVGELSSFLMYTFWVGISIAGKLPIFTLCEICAAFVAVTMPCSSVAILQV